MYSQPFIWDGGHIRGGNVAALKKKKKKKKKKKNKQTLTDNHFIVKKQQCRIKTYNNRCYFHYHELICLASLHFNLFAYLFIKIEGNFV